MDGFTTVYLTLVFFDMRASVVVGGVIGGVVKISPRGYGNLTRTVPGYGHHPCFEHTWTCMNRSQVENLSCRGVLVGY